MEPEEPPTLTPEICPTTVYGTDRPDHPLLYSSHHIGLVRSGSRSRKSHSGCLQRSYRHPCLRETSHLTKGHEGPTGNGVGRRVWRRCEKKKKISGLIFRNLLLPNHRDQESDLRLPRLVRRRFSSLVCRKVSDK